LLANTCFLLLLWWKSLVKVVAMVLLVENFHRKELKMEEQGEGETSELTEREKEWKKKWWEGKREAGEEEEREGEKG
jgi:hypothetical protein